MFSSAASVLFGCFLISRVHGDFFENHVKKFLNHSVRPYDDFYRHVCATENMKPNDYMTTYGDYLKEKWLKEMEEVHWQQSPPSIAELFIRAMETNPLVYVRIHDLQTQSTDRFKEEQIEKFTNTLEYIVYTIFRNGNADDFRKSVEAFDRLLKKDQEFVELTEYNIVYMGGQILGVFKRKYEDVVTAAMQWNANSLDKALNMGPTWNAGALPGRTVEFNDPVFAVTVNNSIPALYGYFGHVAGHELFHSYQLWDNFNDTALGKSARCIASHMNKTCHTYSEGVRCASGQYTFQEDGSDAEGIQLAYKLFVKKIGRELKNKFSDTEFTNQQMFFYSVSTTHCFPNPANCLAKNPDGSDSCDIHSAWFVRSNGNLSLMKAFHEAFQCKPGDRMYDIAKGTEDCNTFGAPVRK